MPDRALKRFVAFAFSAADILVETDLQGRISFTAGALRTVQTLSSLGPSAEFASVFEPGSRQVVRTMLQTAPDEGRAGPRVVRCEGAPFELSLWRMKGAPLVQWAMRPARQAPGETEPSFFDQTRSALEQARLSGGEAALAMIWLEGCDQVRAALGDAHADQFFASLTEIASMHAVNGAAAEIPGLENVIGLVPKDVGELEQIEREIDEIARAEGLERVSARSAATPAASDDFETLIEVFVEAATSLQGGKPGFDPKALALHVQKAMRIAEARTKAVTVTVRNKMFEPYAQAIVDARTREPVEHELLVRLPGGRSFNPGLLLAEQVGVTPDLDLAMVDTALKFLAACPDRPALSVNLSGASLAAEGFRDRLAAVVGDREIDQSRLCFEITETYEIKNFERARLITDMLRQRGFNVALDDFGAGGAGLEYLLRLEVDRVKLDGGLTPRTNPSDWERRIFAGVTQFAQSMGVSLVAERVEQSWQALILESAGVDMLQGYLFAKPEPLSDLAQRHPPRMRRAEEPKAAFG